MCLTFVERGLISSLAPCRSYTRVEIGAVQSQDGVKTHLYVLTRAVQTEAEQINLEMGVRGKATIHSGGMCYYNTE